MEIYVLAVRLVDGVVLARVRADSLPRARLHIELRFPVQKGESPWVTAYDEALRYLDIA